MLAESWLAGSPAERSNRQQSTSGSPTLHQPNWRIKLHTWTPLGQAIHRGQARLIWPMACTTCRTLLSCAAMPTWCHYDPPSRRTIHKLGPDHRGPVMSAIKRSCMVDGYRHCLLLRIMLDPPGSADVILFHVTLCIGGQARSLL